MCQAQHGLTVIFIFKDSIKFSLKAHAFFSVSKVFKKFESQTIWFDLYCPFRKHWSIFIKSTYSKLRSRQIQIETYCPFKDSSCISIESSFLLRQFFFKKIFNQGQYIWIHITHLVICGQSLSESHVIHSMLNFTMFLANSDQETIRTIRFEPYCLYKILVKFPQRLILFSISNAFKKSNWSQHNLTHIVLNIMIFFGLRCIFQSF